MLNSVEPEKILKLLRESAKFSIGHARKLDPHLFSVPLTAEERMLAKVFLIESS